MIKSCILFRYVCLKPSLQNLHIKMKYKYSYQIITYILQDHVIRTIYVGRVSDLSTDTYGGISTGNYGKISFSIYGIYLMFNFNVYCLLRLCLEWITSLQYKELCHFGINILKTMYVVLRNYFFKILRKCFLVTDNCVGIMNTVMNTVSSYGFV